MYLPMVLMTSAMVSPARVGQYTTTATPAVNTPSPNSMPNLRPRLSATMAANGPKVPMTERAVSARDNSAMFTPNPRAKTPRKG